MAAIDDPAASNLSPVRPFNPASLAPNVRLQLPLSRRGKGPGLLIFVPDQGRRASKSTKTLEPEPLQKWAEEGFVVIEVTLGEVTSRPVRDVLSIQDSCDRAIDTFKGLPDCTIEQVGVIGR